jgi:uncharacterized protein (DUF427 family)
MKAIWNGKVIAESNNTIHIEGNQYFPIDSVNEEFLNGSEKSTSCHWKGTASYYNLNVEGKTNKDAAWHYPTPSKLAENIKGHVAFWRGVEISN